ncbi:MAG: tRNA adenosine(34) deaminase TadA [Lentisphaeria bacterium]|nr:tRNA adenosine(34) deaminase TadA [Lentisphaeria bacterium]NQZ69903.1 tRNA adenosine(34) deaminase TadA [Lentisphaeria bacterium]
MKIDRNDETYMAMALKQAMRAYDEDEVPIGAIIVHNDTVIAKAWNQVELLKDATAHAEILAITQASAAIGDWRLQEATLYVTKEPCAMCAGAMINSKLGRLVYALRDERSGAAGSALDITGFDGMLHKVDVTGAVLEEECLQLIQSFFQKRRAEKKAKQK